MFCLKRKSPGEAGRSHAVLLALAIGSAHGVPSGRLDLDGVQEGPQGLSEGPAEKTDTGAGVGSGAQIAQPHPQVQGKDDTGTSFDFLTSLTCAFPYRGSLKSLFCILLLGSPHWVLPSHYLRLSVLPGWGLNRLATYRELELSVR